MARALRVTYSTDLELRVLSIMPKIPEISVGIQMERSVSVSSDRNIRDHFWRWSTYFGWNIPIEIRRSVFDKPVPLPLKSCLTSCLLIKLPNIVQK